MYRTFFNLKSKPFEINTDSNFLWLGEKHKEALAALRYGILENKGFLLMTGDAGTGKSTLVNALTESLDATVIWAVIKDPLLERLDFYNAISKGFGITKECTSKVQFLIQFSHFLHKADDEGKKVLLVIDDCHRLSQDMLEELRLLSNIEKADAKLINIFFVGQREFNEMLVHPNKRAVRQRLAIKADLVALTAGETDEYIHHRLQVAGTDEEFFSDKAKQIIHRYAMGIPKRINIICDHALAAGAVQGKRDLDHTILEECIQKLNFPLKSAQEDSKGFDDGKSRFEHPRNGTVGGSLGVPAAVSGINTENFARSRWLKLGVGGMVLALTAVYFWYPGSKSPNIQGIVPQKVEQQAVVKEAPPIDKPSPAVTVLEQNPEKINEKKVAEMKHAILEKAYNNGEHAQQETAELSGTKAGDAAQIAGSAVEPSEVKDQAAKTAAVQEIAPIVTTNGAIKGSEIAVKAQEQTPKIEEPAAVNKDKEKLPILPYKIVLPLASNSLKVTDEANKEYQGFIEKLKSYPKARLLIKGFVSSTTESTENTKMSEERAMAVQKMFVASGIETARIQIKGMGIQEPILPNNTSEGRAKNRRVEVYVVENETAYNNSEHAQQGTAEPSGAKAGDAVQIVGNAAQPSEVKDQAAKTAAVKEIAPIVTTNGAIKGSEIAAKAQEQTPKIEEPATANKDKEKLPVLPYKIVLPLAGNSLKVTDEANKEYQGFVEKLKSHPKANLLIKGFVSSLTESAENTKLSEERAMAVQKMFVGSGIETARIQIKGMGIQEPILPNNTSEGRAKNRRVEVYVIENEQ